MSNPRYTSADRLARHVNRYLRLQEGLKPQYQKLDALLDKILAAGMKVNQIAGNGILLDNFATGNKAFKTAAFTRFSIERVKAQ